MTCTHILHVISVFCLLTLASGDTAILLPQSVKFNWLEHCYNLLLEWPFTPSVFIGRTDYFELSYLVYFWIVQTHSCPQIRRHWKQGLPCVNKWPISSLWGFRDMRCMLAVTPSANPEPSRSNAGMIYVPCPSLHTACSPALELLAKPNYSSNLSPYVCRRWGAKVSEMKMTRPDLIVVSICGSRQDVCLNVHLSICPSVWLLSWRRVFLWVGRDALAAVSHYSALIWSIQGSLKRGAGKIV